MCQIRGPWFDALRIRIGAFVATAPPEVGRNVRSLRQIYEECRELDNCDDTEVMALSVMHDLWGYELLSCRRFDSSRRHFEKALRAYESNVTTTDFLGASLLAFTSLMNGETLSFDDAIARFDMWLSDEAKATLRRFYDAYKSEDIAVVEEVVTSLKESNDKLADVTEHYASVLHTKLRLRQLGKNTNLAWTLVFDRLSHRDLHVVQFACRSFRSILRPRLRHAPIGPIIVSAQQGPWRNEWALQGLALRPYWRATCQDPITTVELVERLEECGSLPVPKLLIRGDAPFDHPHLMEYVAKHEVVELVLETDLSGLAYEPLRRFLQGWKSIGSLTISSSNEADSVCVSDELLRDAAELGIEKVSVRCERAARITDEGILDFWLGVTCRSLEVVRPAISQDFFRRLVEACAPSDALGKAALTVYSSPNDVLRQLKWDDYFDNRKVAGPSGTTYEFTTDGVILEMKISLDEYCRLEEGQKYDVLRVTRRPLDW